jgi:hypothetical protein
MPLDPKLVRAAVEATLDEKMKATETGDRAPDEMGTVTGWRAWDVDRKPDENGQVLLRSVTYQYAWVPFEKARASCDRCLNTDPSAPDCVPGEHCGCGFYTARSLQHLRTMGYHSYQADRDGPVTIVGRVANWGKVIPGSQGFRAEYAYPEMLFVPFEVARFIAKPVSETYGIPVTLFNLLDPDAKPGKRLRKPHHVLEPQRKEPKFLAEYRKAQRQDSFDEDDLNEFED